jgi:hypothetical protein
MLTVLVQLDDEAQAAHLSACSDRVESRARLMPADRAPITLRSHYHLPSRAQRASTVFNCVIASSVSTSPARCMWSSAARTDTPSDLQSPSACHTDAANQRSPRLCLRSALSDPSVLGPGVRGASRCSLANNPCWANMLLQSLFAQVYTLADRVDGLQCLASQPMLLLRILL